MTSINPTIRSMTFDEADHAGLHSRGLMLEYENRSYKLNSGTSDNIQGDNNGADACINVFTLTELDSKGNTSVSLDGKHRLTPPESP